MTTNLVDAAAIVLNFRSAQSTAGVAEAVLRGSLLPRAVIVIDNGSGDDSEGYLTSWAVSQTPQATRRGVAIRVIALPVNGGYGAGNNAGLQAATELGVEWAWVLNHDAEPDPHALEEMWHATKLSDAGVIGATLLNEDGTVQCVGGAHYNALLTRTRPLDFGDYNDLHPEPDYAPKALSYVAGSCLLLRMSAIGEVGSFVEDHFLFFEELDLASRLEAAGWQAAVAKQAVVVHRQGITSGGHADLDRKTDTAAYYATRAAMLYARRHRPLTLPSAVVVRTAHAVLLWLKGHRTLGKATLLGLADGIAGRTGLRPFRQSMQRRDTSAAEQA